MQQRYLLRTYLQWVWIIKPELRMSLGTPREDLGSLAPLLRIPSHVTPWGSFKAVEGSA